MRKVGAALTIIAVLSALLWIDGEMHYRNCVNAAVATTPPPQRGATTIDEQLDDLRDGTPTAIDTSRAEAVSACSRIPL